MNYVQEKAAKWQEAKDRGLQGDLKYQTVTLEELEAILEQSAPVDFCQGDCKPLTRKHLRNERGTWTLVPFGKDGIQYFQRGPEISHCPFCGRELDRG